MICTCLSDDGPWAGRDEPGIPYSYVPVLRAGCAVHGEKVCAVNPCSRPATVKAWGFDLCREHYAAILAQGGEVKGADMTTTTEIPVDTILIEKVLKDSKGRYIPGPIYEIHSRNGLAFEIREGVGGWCWGAFEPIRSWYDRTDWREYQKPKEASRQWNNQPK